jgi:Mce-associated membrane protein
MAEHADAADRQLNGLPPADHDGQTDKPVEYEHEIDEHEIDENETDENETDENEDNSAETRVHRRLSKLGTAIAAGVASVLGLVSLAGWLGYRTYENQQEQVTRKEFVETARQGAVNLTTIDYTHVEVDIQRVLNSTTGTFHDDFKKRSQPFVDVVKQAQSKSQGTVTEAGLESQNGDQAQVLVAVSVETSNAGASEQQPRAWRMRINVQKVGDAIKVSDVQFVP